MSTNVQPSVPPACARACSGCFWLLQAENIVLAPSALGVLLDAKTGRRTLLRRRRVRAEEHLRRLHPLLRVCLHRRTTGLHLVASPSPGVCACQTLLHLCTCARPRQHRLPPVCLFQALRSPTPILAGAFARAEIIALLELILRRQRRRNEAAPDTSGETGEAARKNTHFLILQRSSVYYLVRTKG